MMELLTNTLVEIFAEEIIFRVLWVDPLGRGYYTIDVQSDAAFPVFRPSADLQPLLEQGLARIYEADLWLAPLFDGDLPESHRAKRDQAWALISPLVLNAPDIFKTKVRGQAIAALVKQRKATKQTLYRMLRRYWQRGMTPNALLPDFPRCGSPGKDRKVSEDRRRETAIDGVFNPVIDAETRNLFRAVVTRHFTKNRQLDLRACYEGLIQDHYTDKVLDERNGQTILAPRPPYPSLRQFRYWFEKDNDVFHIERLRRTPRVYDKNMRAIIGSSTAETIGPGSRYQIDATIGDVYLVSRFNRSKIIGRPVIYIVIDVFSRMITGVYVGLEGPSWVGAMMALANAASSKVEYCRRFGIDIGEGDWPCEAMPDALLGDRGEMAGEMVETLAKTLRVHVENTAPFRPDWKSIVEQRFKLIPSRFKAYTPGYIAPDYQERGGKDYRLDGTLDLDEFTAIFIRCVLYYNNHHVFEDYRRHPDMIADEVPPIPIELWEWGIVRRSGILRSFPQEMVRLSLLPSDQATVTAKGIVYKGCFYSCSKAMEEHWFERARQKGNWKLRFSYDPRCMDEIFLHEEGPSTRFVSCALTDASSDYRGKSLWEIEQLRQEGRRQLAASRPDQLAGRVNLNDAIQNIVSQAKAKTQAERALNPSSDRSRVKDIRKNRSAEKDANRKEEVFRFSKPELPAPATVVPFPVPKAGDYSEPDITEILRSLGEDGDDDQ